MLRRLSGREHTVITGICLRHPGGVQVDSSATRVRFTPLTDAGNRRLRRHRRTHGQGRRLRHPGTRLQVRRTRRRLLLQRHRTAFVPGVPVLEITGINCSLIWCFGRHSRSLLGSIALFAADRSPAPVTNLELQGKITGASSLRSLRVNLFGVETPYVESAEVNRAGRIPVPLARSRQLHRGRGSQRLGRSSPHGGGERRGGRPVRSRAHDHSLQLRPKRPPIPTAAWCPFTSFRFRETPPPSTPMRKSGWPRTIRRARSVFWKRLSPIAPEFSAAWNALGVIAFQTGDDDRAETLFRKALAADPGRVRTSGEPGRRLAKESTEEAAAARRCRSTSAPYRTGPRMLWRMPSSG